jgi:hypothetical protein
VIQPREDSAQANPHVDIVREVNLEGSGEYNIILTARQRGSLPTALWNCSYFLFLGDQLN